MGEVGGLEFRNIKRSSDPGGNQCNHPTATATNNQQQPTISKMKTIALFVLVAFVAALANGQPRRPHPRQAMMITGGFYGHEDGPRGSMSAYASRDTNNEEEDSVEDETNQAVETEAAAAEDEQQQQQEDEVSTTVKPKKVSAKRKPAIKPQEEEEQIHHGSRNDFPGYGSFFPIIFGGAGAQRNAGEGYRPGTIAIANSFSTGKGGVASSHATSFGNPDIESLLRQFNSRRNSKADN